jgi:ribonuclease BN (tRNA processing enzyme)
MSLKIIGSGNVRAPEISASALIDETILIDCGYNVYKRLLQPDIDINKLQYIFITHLHSDHFFDLTAILSYNNFINKNEQNIPKLQVFLPPGGIDTLTILAIYALNLNDDPKTWLTSVADLHKYTADIPIKFQNYEVTPLLVDHGPMKPAYGFIVKTPEKTIGFSGDSVLCPNIDRIVKESDIAVLDASNLDSNFSHMGLKDVANYAHQYPNKLFLGTHLSTEVRKYYQNLPANLHLLQDGEIFD